ELRAAVLLRIGARLARLLRAGVLRVGDAVLVGIVLGAAVLIVDPVEVLGLVGALVADVGDAVAAPLGERRAAVVGVRRLVILGVVRAEIDVVRDPVVIAVGAVLGVALHLEALAGRVGIGVGDAERVADHPDQAEVGRVPGGE